MFLSIKRHLTKAFCEAYAKAANKQYEEAMSTNHPAKDPDLTVQEQKMKELFCEVYSYEVASTHDLVFSYTDDPTGVNDPTGVSLFKDGILIKLFTREELVYKYITKHW